MKKQMLSIILLFSLFTQDLISMEQEPKICYLALVSIDVQNLIADYLFFDDRETDAELIERAHEASKLPRPIELCEAKYMKWPEGDVGCMECVASYLTDPSKILFVEKYHKKGVYTPVVSIIDTKQDKKTANPLLSDLAKSSMPRLDGMITVKNRVLVVRLLRVAYEENILSGHRLWHEIMLHDLKLDSEKLIDRVNHKIILCEFNKQTTKIITLFFPENGSKKIPNYVIYPISSEAEHAAKSKKTLGDYFRQRFVCKNLVNSLKT